MTDVVSGDSGAPGPPPPSPPPQPRTGLLEQLKEAPVTAVLFALCVAVFIAAEKSGSTQKTETLLAFGATWRWAVWRGEWWRLVTSMFLHIGLVHLAWNLYAGWSWCRPIERFLGHGRFLVLYLVSGVVGSAASVLGQNVVSAGASGAMFGVVGVVFAADRAMSGSWKVTLFERQKRNAGMAALWLVLGAQAGFDTWGHLGGLVAGLALGGLWLGGSRRVMRPVVATVLLVVPLSLRPWRELDVGRLAEIRIEESAKSRRWADVLDEAERAPSLVKADPWVLELRLEALDAVGRPHEGVALARRLVDEQADGPRYGLLAQAYRYTGQLDAGLSAADEAVRLSPKEPLLWRARAWLRAETGDFTGCAEDFARMQALVGLEKEDRELLERCRAQSALPEDAGSP